MIEPEAQSHDGVLADFTYACRGCGGTVTVINSFRQTHNCSLVIPPEALEAAHRAWREQAALDGSIFEYNLRAALEAAAQVLMAIAWEEGRQADDFEVSIGLEKNPYRK